MLPTLDIRPEVAAALKAGRPVVALITAPLTHSLPRPVNLETALGAAKAVQSAGAVPAFLAVLRGRLTVGLDEAGLAELSHADNTMKASRRDLGIAVAQGRSAGTSVGAGLAMAHWAGIRLLASGNIGGAHGDAQSWDISADLLELSRTPVAVVCGGARSILDLTRTAQILESYSVPVIGYQTSHFPAFYIALSQTAVSARVNTPQEAAGVLTAHWDTGGAGLVLAQPAAAEVALEPDEFAYGLLQVERQAASDLPGSPPISLTARLSRLTRGKTVRAYHAIYIASARLAAEVAVRVAGLR
jgi:pseudouridylate synthase